MNPTIHWIGAGMSSRAGILRLARAKRRFTLWNRTVSKAETVAAMAHPAQVRVRGFSLDELAEALSPGDVAVSMLPAPMHPAVAAVCLKTKAHLVTTSYVSAEMRAFDPKAKAAGLAFVNESGLDPGLDHLLAHELLDDFRGRRTNGGDPLYGAALSFKSFCGGVPEEPGPFRYKFNWAPTSVLRALKGRARYLKDGRPVETGRPWTELSTVRFGGETFEVYPNRDSIPYIESYGFDPAWRLDHFIRGTLRPEGWSAAWSEVFRRLDAGEPPEKIGPELFERHPYRKGERDRVVLYVGLEAKAEGKSLWSRSYGINALGGDEGTAMSRLVSLPAAYAVETVLAGRAPSGVSQAVADKGERRRWLRELAGEGIRVLDADGRPASLS